MAKQYFQLLMECSQVSIDAQKEKLPQNLFVAKLGKVLNQEIECGNCGKILNAKRAATLGARWEFSLNCPNCGASWGGVSSH